MAKKSVVPPEHVWVVMVDDEVENWESSLVGAQLTVAEVLKCGYKYSKVLILEVVEVWETEIPPPEFVLVELDSLLE